MNGVRLNSLALGLERKAKFGGTLESHLQSLADREHSEESDISKSENLPEAPESIPNATDESESGTEQ
jgi:hypothetical protein